MQDSRWIRTGLAVVLAAMLLALAFTFIAATPVQAAGCIGTSCDDSSDCPGGDFCYCVINRGWCAINK